jgi:SAM-dependent methyltransferase
MHPRAYTSLAALEPVGWYYQARARCLARLIERYVDVGHGPLRILDVGCGTGGTSNSLCRFGHVTGLEPSPQAIELLRARYPQLNVMQGTVDEVASLVRPSSFDLATVMGVLYHRQVIDPALALTQINRTLKPGGWLIWNEGVYPLLARDHDEFVEAGRRFRPRQMRQLLDSQGFSVRFGSHLLGWGFPIALSLAMLHRAKRRLLGGNSYDDHVSDDRQLPRGMNALLREVTYFEWACSLRRLKLPWGVSYLVIAQKAPVQTAP